MSEKNMTECELMAEACDKVKGIVTGSRNKCYGTPSENHALTAAFWSLFLSRKFGFPITITASDHCWMMTLLKASREAHWSQEDNNIDGAGYLMNALACKHAENQESTVQDDNAGDIPGFRTEDNDSDSGS